MQISSIVKLTLDNYEPFHNMFCRVLHKLALHRTVRVRMYMVVDRISHTVAYDVFRMNF